MALLLSLLIENVNTASATTFPKTLLTTSVTDISLSPTVISDGIPLETVGIMAMTYT